MARDYTLQALRATTAARLADTPSDGEVVIDTTLRAANAPYLFVGDGATAGGDPIAYLSTETGGSVTGNVTVDGDIRLINTGAHARYLAFGTSTAYEHWDTDAAAGAQRFRDSVSNGQWSFQSMTDGGGIDATPMRIWHRNTNDANGGVGVGLVSDPGHGWIASEKGFKLDSDPIGMTRVGGLTAILDVTGDLVLTTVNLAGVPLTATGVLLIASSISAAGDTAVIRINRFDLTVTAPDSVPYFVAKDSGVNSIDITISNSAAGYRTLIYVEGYII